MLDIHSFATEDSISLWWEKPEEHIDCYDLELNGAFAGTTSKTHFEFTGLEPDTDYSVSIRYSGECESASYRTGKMRVRIDVTLPPYNAAGDGKTLNTEVLQKALDDASSDNCIYIPRGVFMTGALRVHSNTELYIDEGAVLQGTSESKDYLPRIPSRFEGIEAECYSSVLNIGYMDHEAPADSAENILIRGGGTIASGGHVLAERIIQEETVRLADYLKALGSKIEECEKPETIPGRVRPRLVNISNAQDIHISNITLRDGASWNVHMIYSRNITADHCRFISEKVWNGDGWDPDSSEHCTLYASEFWTGDDSVAIKSGKNPEGNIIARPARAIRVFDCISHSGHGIMIGSEMSGGIEDVAFWDNDISSSSNGFEMKGTWKRGGYVRNIRIRDSAAPCVTIHAVPYNNDGEPAPDKPLFSDMSFENLHLSGIRTDNITGERSSGPVIDIDGFDNDTHTVKNIVFSGIRIPESCPGIMKIRNVEDVVVKGLLTE